mmetsp:Transcript_39736/g.83025  ORF Transcript_39736/g.83025 Transcript_39736/m.83025 type:complete len:335 (+) Transcript_39736:1005-2009(+)
MESNVSPQQLSVPLVHRAPSSEQGLLALHVECVCPSPCHASSWWPTPCPSLPQPSSVQGIAGSSSLSLSPSVEVLEESSHDPPDLPHLEEPPDLPLLLESDEIVEESGPPQASSLHPPSVLVGVLELEEPQPPPLLLPQILLPESPPSPDLPLLLLSLLEVDELSAPQESSFHPPLALVVSEEEDPPLLPDLPPLPEVPLEVEELSLLHPSSVQGSSILVLVLPFQCLALLPLPLQGVEMLLGPQNPPPHPSQSPEALSHWEGPVHPPTHVQCPPSPPWSPLELLDELHQPLAPLPPLAPLESLPHLELLEPLPHEPLPPLSPLELDLPPLPDQ